MSDAQVGHVETVLPADDRRVDDWWIELQKTNLRLDAALAAAQQRAPWWVPDTRTGIVYWMMASSFMLLVLFWWKPPDASNQLINTLVGLYVGTGLISALQWWMGSSKGSDDKTQAIISSQK